jgi:hypothetical protein
MSRADRACPGTAAADGHTANSLRLLLELVHRAGMSVRVDAWSRCDGCNERRSLLWSSPIA